MAGICYRKPAITMQCAYISETNKKMTHDRGSTFEGENSQTILYSREEKVRKRGRDIDRASEREREREREKDA